ncbi:MAG TPA: hypothetical protein DCZ23_05070 [Lachnospiraceae bacterium]|nr:hypothetical protein [Lachnospiraceae bacterium]
MFSKYKLHISAQNSKIEDMKKLYTGFESADMEKLYFCRLFSIAMLAISGISLFLLAFTVMPDKSSILERDYYIERDTPAGQDREEDLAVSIGKDEKDITVNIPAKKYSAVEYKIKLDEAIEYVRKNYLGENQSPDEVSQSLNLISYIPENAIKISWECDTEGIVDSDGSLKRIGLTEPKAVQITAVFSYYENEKRITLDLTVIPIEKSSSEILWDKWKEKYIELSESTACQDFLQLPSVIEGKKILYKVQESNYILVIIALGIFVIALIPVILDSRMKEKIEHREQELRLDYPEFVEKFVLLISAGLNCKGAWHRMTQEYKRMLKNGGKKRYLYEEMLLTERQLSNGMNEGKAYELFGKRMGLLKYMKFSTVLVQNLKKGSADLLNILEYESADVLKERRENAKILGEQAGTKLLMPMMLMMLEVFAIIIIAAFQNM